MKAMILAAGLGTRMRPLTDTLPKPLLKAGRYSLIEYHIMALARSGITEIVINLFYLGDAIRRALGDGQRYGVTIHYSDEELRLETAGGIIKALPLLGDNPFIVVNGDIWSDYCFDSLQALELGESLAHLVMVDNPPHNERGDFQLLSDGRLSASEEVQDGRYTFSGISLLSPKLFASLPAGPRPLAPLLREAMQASAVTGELFAGQWWDIGTPERLAQLDAMLGADTRPN
ncbi:MAG: nucleotidyltransferase family protein [Pseudohongiellaceae bacterium]|nr:nucleotidyltransferase family protein [Pseudohongiellaceae bacterium]